LKGKKKKGKNLDDAPASAARTLNAARAGATLLFEDATEDVKTREETAEVDACNENDIVFVLAWVLRSGDFERVQSDAAKHRRLGFVSYDLRP
jgi:hypothetical protein